MADDSRWRRGNPSTFIPVGDVGEATKWLPYARVQLEVMMNNLVAAPTDLQPYRRRTYRPADGVTITLESLHGIPRITIEAGGYEYIAVGDSFQSALQGLYAGKFGLDEIGKIVDPYTFNGGSFAFGPGGDVGKSLLYAGGNTFITGPTHQGVSPAHSAVIKVAGTQVSKKLLPDAGGGILDVFYGGKAPGGTPRYEAYGPKNANMEGTASPDFSWAAFYGAPTYTSTGGLGATIAVTGGPALVEAELEALFAAYAPPPMTAHESIIGQLVGEGLGLPTNFVYLGYDVTVPYLGGPTTITTGAYALAESPKDDEIERRQAQAFDFPFGAVEPTFSISAQTTTHTIGSVETKDFMATTTVEFNFDFTFKVWPNRLTSTKAIYDDIIYARYNTPSGAVAYLYAGGMQPLEYEVYPTYCWVKTANIHNGAGVRLSNGRIAILLTTNAAIDHRAPFNGENFYNFPVYNSTDLITNYFETTITIVSDDNGQTWRATVTPGEIYTFGSLVYIGGDSILAFSSILNSSLTGVWRSDDGGVSYALVCSTLPDSPASYPICLAPGVAGFYASRSNPSNGYSRFYRTIDSGATWTSYEIPNTILEKPYNVFAGRIAILSTNVPSPDPENPLPAHKKVRLAMVFEMPPGLNEEGVTIQTSKVIISDDGGETWRVDATVSVDTVPPITTAHAIGVDIGPLNTGLPPNPALPDMYVEPPPE